MAFKKERNCINIFFFLIQNLFPLLEKELEDGTGNYASKLSNCTGLNWSRAPVWCSEISQCICTEAVVSSQWLHTVRHNGPVRKSIALLWWLTLARGCPESITCSSLQGRKRASTQHSSLPPSLRLDLLCIWKVLLTFPTPIPFFFFFLTVFSLKKNLLCFIPSWHLLLGEHRLTIEMSSVYKLCYNWKWGRY